MAIFAYEMIKVDLWTGVLKCDLPFLLPFGRFYRFSFFVIF